MGQRRNQSRLLIVLLGRVAAKGLELLETTLTTRCTLRPFSEIRDNESLLEELGEADVVVSHYFTGRMARAAGNLKLLQAVGAGMDHFCLHKLSPHTTVANVYLHGPAIGEYVMMMILALSRNLLTVDSQFRKGIWQGSSIWGDPPAEGIQGKVLGLIGFGHIGREVASRARAFGMQIRIVSAHPPTRKPKTVEFWEGPGQLIDLLRGSDYVVLACPLNETTRGMIGAKELGWMKPSAFLINVARGPLVEESALYHALRTGRIRGGAVDVWYRYPDDKTPYPPSRFPFHKLDNVIVTPHISGWTQETREQRLRTIAANIDRLASGRPLLNVLQGPGKHNPMKLPRIVERINAGYDRGLNRPDRQRRS